MQPWVEQQAENWQHDPEYRCEEVLLDIGEQIASLMEKQGLTRSDLATRLGVSRSWVTQVLNGKPNMSVLALVRIAVPLRTELRVGFEASGSVVSLRNEC